MLDSSRQIRQWRENPKKFVYDCFDVTPDKWQEKVLDAFGAQDEYRMRISLQACAGPGKSAVLSWCGWNFLSCYGSSGEHPKGAAVAVTQDNLKDNLWTELSKWQQRHEGLRRAFTWTKSRIFNNDHPETWFLSARSWSKSANADEQGRTLSGVHGRFVLFLIDESGEIPVSVMKAANQALSTSDLRFGRIMQAGNPTSHEGMLYAAATTEADQWYVVRITGDPDDEDRSLRIDINYARDMIAKYGRDDPWVMSYILGKFPKTSINTLLSVDQVDEAMCRKLRGDAYMYSQKRLGVDVARFGADSTIIFPRQGLASFKYVEMRGARSYEIAARVMKAKIDWGSEFEFVDGTGGYGAGVIDDLFKDGQSPHEVQFSGKALDPRYFNKRSEMWFEMAEWIKRGGALPKCGKLKKELTAPTYTFQNGKMKLEEKDQIKARLGFSPDIADALCLTFALPDMPSQDKHLAMMQAHRGITSYNPEDARFVNTNQGKAKTEWNPFV